jgi:hypothetical protein
MNNEQRQADAEAYRKRLRDELAMRAPISLEQAAVAAGFCAEGEFRACLQRAYLNETPLLGAHAHLCYRWADAMMKARLE